MFKERELSPKNFFLKHPPFIDHDETNSASIVVVTNFYNKLYSSGKIRKPNDITHYHSVRDWAIEDGHDVEDANYIEKNLWFNPDVLFYAKPTKGAVEFSYQMHQLGFAIPVVTARIDFTDIKPNNFKDMLDSTVAWYDKWMPWVNSDDIHVQSNTEMPREIYKAYILEKLGAGIYIEDSTSNAEAILNYTNIMVCLLSNKILASQVGNPNLIRLSGAGGKEPDMMTVYKHFFENNEWVAQY
jgi:hypothetical protein